MELKAIFLDIDNTLLDFDAAAQQSMEESFHKFGLSFHPDMMRIFNEENDKIWRRIEKKEISIADSKEHLVRPAYAVLDNFISPCSLADNPAKAGSSGRRGSNGEGIQIPPSYQCSSGRRCP